MDKNGKYLFIHNNDIIFSDTKSRVKKYLMAHYKDIDNILVFSIKGNKIERLTIKSKIENIH